MTSDPPSASEDRNGSGYNAAHADLHRLSLRLREILESIYAFEPPIRVPPVLDTSLVNDDASRVGGVRLAGKAALPGLRGLEESVRRDLDVLTKVGENILQGVPAGRTHRLHRLVVLGRSKKRRASAAFNERTLSRGCVG